MKFDRMYVGGRWTEAADAQRFEVLDPATGETVGEVPDGGAADIRAAIESAQAAFKAWAATSPKERGRILHRVQAALEARQEEIARLIVLENGKPLEEAKREIAFALGYFGWFGEEARRAYGELVPSPFPGKRLWVLHQPIGVVGAITPWNFPAIMVTRKIAPALAAGCPVVLKPASATPFTALAIAEAGEAAGLPPGVFNVVTSRRSRLIAEELLSSPVVRKIAFTGSTEVGKALMEKAARQLKRVAFELGGNAPFIVFDDADLEAAVEGAVAIKYLRVAGQSCICANRIYVQASVADRFIPRFVERVRALRVGPGFEPEVVIGPLINEETRKKVHDLVEDAVSRGARLATGGAPLTEGALSRGYFYAPTVLLDVDDDMPVCREEIFGPAAPVLTFHDEAEVIERANRTEFGLASYLYSRDLGRITRVAERLEYGLVGVNDAAGYTHEIPFGGFKESGLGREGGREGLLEYMETKSVVVALPQ